MPPRKLPDGRWLVDLRPDGAGGRRIRKKFDTRPQAVRFEVWCLNQAQQELPWNPADSDNRRLSELCSLWHELHGHALKGSADRLRVLQALCQRLGDPPVSRFTATDFTKYRATRLQESRPRGRPPVTANTVNHEQAYLRAVFNELARLGEFNGDNPLAGVRPIRLDESALTYLDHDQVKALFEALDASGSVHVRLVALVCLSTGARWSEAQGLTISKVRGGRIRFDNTKGGRSRSVPITEELEEALKAHRKEHRLEGGALFQDCYSAFKRSVDQSGLELPKGQKSHVLRHTFASHFVMQGGNILTLQKILGHVDIKMTLRYAHLAPDHLEDARRLNIGGHFVDT